MFTHPDLALAVSHERQRDMLAESARTHLLAEARAARRARKVPAARGRPAGTLASCEPSAAVPAR